MDEVDTPQRPRKPRAKNTFQLEIENKLRERRAKGLTADVTSEESEEDSAMDMQFGTLRHQNRPSSAKRRGDHASTWQPGLGDTLRTQDIEKLLGRKTPTNFDEEDDEIATTLRQKPSSLSQRRTPTPKDGLLGRKTPSSPQTEMMSKEDIIFGRKTPTQLRGKSPQGGSDLPNLGGQPWQPPNFRNISPSAEQRLSPAGSQGRRTPGLDSGLDPISETRETQRTPRLGSGLDRRGSPGQTDESPRSDKPTPRARHRMAEKEAARPARTTPTLDLFGKSRRESTFELEKELKDTDDRRRVDDRLGGRKTPTDRKTSVEDRLGGRKTPTDRKTSVEDRLGGRKTPTDRNTTAGRKSPGFGGRASPAAAMAAMEDRRSDNRRSGRRSPADELLKRSEKSPKKEEGTSSLLAFLTGETEEKPKLKERPPRRTKIPKEDYKEAFDIGEVPSGLHPQLPAPRSRKFQDDSSVCEEVKEDPSASSRKITDSGDGKRIGKQRTERQAAEDAIDRVVQEQKRIDFKPVKKVRPVSAQAKVQHRPKPRYGTLPGQTSKEAAVPEYNSTLDIRDAVYEDWYHKRMKAAKEDKKEKQRKEEEEAKKKKEAQEEKRTEAMLSYKAWEEKKKDLLAKEKTKKKEEEEKKKQKEQEQREEKRVEAEVTFKIWKEKKDEKLKEKSSQQKMKEREKKEREAESKAEREKDSLSAFRGWKTRKDEVLKDKARHGKRQKKEEEMRLLATQKQKEEEAQDRYDRWMENKEKQEHRKLIESRRKMMSGEEDFRPPWSPANHIVPFGR